VMSCSTFMIMTEERRALNAKMTVFCWRGDSLSKLPCVSSRRMQTSLPPDNFTTNGSDQTFIPFVTAAPPPHQLNAFPTLSGWNHEGPTEAAAALPPPSVLLIASRYWRKKLSVRDFPLRNLPLMEMETNGLGPTLSRRSFKGRGSRVIPSPVVRITGTLLPGAILRQLMELVVI
jgi:hypothetical protein